MTLATKKVFFSTFDNALELMESEESSGGVWRGGFEEKLKAVARAKVAIVFNVLFTALASAAMKYKPTI